MTIFTFFLPYMKKFVNEMLPVICEAKLFSPCLPENLSAAFILLITVPSKEGGEKRKSEGGCQEMDFYYNISNK
jgi:hypothetical protein